MNGRSGVAGRLLGGGVSPRPGTTLFFGDAAAAVVKRSDRSILLVAS
jgi:hypothetical protein